MVWTERKKNFFVQHIEIAYCLLASVAGFERSAIYLVIPLKLTCPFYPTFKFILHKAASLIAVCRHEPLLPLGALCVSVPHFGL